MSWLVEDRILGRGWGSMWLIMLGRCVIFGSWGSCGSCSWVWVGVFSIVVRVVVRVRVRIVFMSVVVFVEDNE